MKPLICRKAGPTMRRKRSRNLDARAFPHALSSATLTVATLSHGTPT
jgi:hypothetical protein